MTLSEDTTFTRVRRYFRTRRNRQLADLMQAIVTEARRPIRVLDVGGSPFFWETVSLPQRSQIVLLNLEESKDRAAFKESPLKDLLAFEVGDGRSIKHPDASFDLIVSNSVLEHVGTYADMMMMANEIRRVGKRGWVQVPAYGFPIEPHFRLPFVHWLGQPTRARLLRLAKTRYRSYSAGAMRAIVEEVNLLTRQEFLELFPESRYIPERIGPLTKSHIATW